MNKGDARRSGQRGSVAPPTYVLDAKTATAAVFQMEVWQQNRFSIVRVLDGVIRIEYEYE